MESAPALLFVSGKLAVETESGPEPIETCHSRYASTRCRLKNGFRL